jgi:hypothetical protein
MDLDNPLSPTLQRKVTAQGTRLSSFREAKESLAETFEIDLTIKQIERVTQRIGAAVSARRDALVANWEALSLVQKEVAPAGVTLPEVAAVSADGGRLQLTRREEESGTHWREDKAAVLMEMTSPTHEEDPCPEVPSGFLDSTWAGRIARDIGKCAAAEPRPNSVSEPSSKEPTPCADELRVASGLAEPTANASRATTPVDAPSPPPDDADASRREPPKLVRKHVVATLENSRSFSPRSPPRPGPWDSSGPNARPTLETARTGCGPSSRNDSSHLDSWASWISFTR